MKLAIVVAVVAACYFEGALAGGDQNPCSLPFDSGDASCYDDVTQWFFDFDAGTCATFKYSGCGGNENNFNSEDECMARCVGEPIYESEANEVSKALYESETSEVSAASENSYPSAEQDPNYEY